jgi:hypothetical protein
MNVFLTNHARCLQTLAGATINPRGMFKTSSGNMHIKSSPNWDIGAAVRYTESLGYKRMYSIEVTPEAIRIVDNTILANVS